MGKYFYFSNVTGNFGSFHPCEDENVIHSFTVMMKMIIENLISSLTIANENNYTIKSKRAYGQRLPFAGNIRLTLAILSNLSIFMSI